MYAIIKAGGRQEKVAVGSEFTVNLTATDEKGKATFPAVLLVKEGKVTTAPEQLAKVRVIAELLEDLRGPKIRIQKFKNKTGYKKRQGHRQELSRFRVEKIEA